MIRVVLRCWLVGHGPKCNTAPGIPPYQFELELQDEIGVIYAAEQITLTEIIVSLGRPVRGYQFSSLDTPGRLGAAFHDPIAQILAVEQRHKAVSHNRRSGRRWGDSSALR